MDLIHQFKQKNASLFLPNTKYLLAVSGGLDSMVMLHLCVTCKLNFAIAHCNFSLRNEESVRDEMFVKRAAQNYGINIYTKTFNTKKIAKELKLSIQETARKLRYDFFNELIELHNFNFVFTAHHQNDNVETVLINLLRGTGIKGLVGIKKQRNSIYRPLIFALRKEIENYAIKNKIEFVEDSSNRKDEYLRNNIRHHVIPEIEKIDITAMNSISKSTDTIEKEIELYECFMNDWIAKNCAKTKSGFIIDAQKLATIPNSWLIIKHLLKPENVSELEIEKFMQSNTGSIFETIAHRVLKNRNEFIFETKREVKNVNIEFVFEDTLAIQNLKIEIVENLDGYVFDKNKNVAQLDFDKLSYPLKLRVWQHADTFNPFGMKGKKLVSDFLINNKISRFQKETIKVLLSNDEIVWVVGMRVDDRFAITSSSKKIIKITASAV